MKNKYPYIKAVLMMAALSALMLSAKSQTVAAVDEKKISTYAGVSYIAAVSVTLQPGFSFSASPGSTFSISIIPAAAINVQSSSLTSISTKSKGVLTYPQLINLPAVQKQISVTCLDGMGRVIQSIDQQGSPLQKDMIQGFDYNRTGGYSVQYLPYTSNTANGNYQPDFKASQAAFYQSGDKIAADAKPYAITKYDGSAFNMVTEQGSAGADWQPETGKTTKLIARLNTSADHVTKFAASGSAGVYAPEQLAVSEIINEQGNKIISFADANGRQILKKEQLDETITEGSTSENVSWLETYYVYDDMGSLIYQVPPKASAKLKAGAVWNTAFIEEWVFKYVYDDQLRLVEKKVPGSGAVQIVYDQLDRPVLTQDAKLRTQNKWMFTKFDLAKRPVMQGIYTWSALYPSLSLSQRGDLQKYFDEQNYDTPDTYYHEKRLSGTTHGYSSQVFPTAGIEVLTVNYYDHYDFNFDGTADYAYSAPALAGAETAASSNTQGQLTGSKKKVLGTSTWLTAVVFYDEEGRPIQKQSNNQLHNTPVLEDIQSLVYEGFSAVPKLSKQVKRSSATASITVNNRIEVDHRYRVKEVYQSNNGSAEQLIGKYTYNELGQLIDKSLHKKSNGSFLQSLDYRYTIRGWLSRINNSSLTAETDDSGVSDVFGMEFAYNETIAGLTASTNARYDGRLAAVKWKTSDVNSASSTLVRERSYRFEYDKVRRLKNALYAGLSTTGWNAETGGYDEKDIRYDYNGNILALKRFFIANGTTTASLMDNLSCTYSGNQLKKVKDNSGSNEGFKDGSDTAEEYLYDESGNLITDKNKGDGTTALSISYNELGKTSRVDLPGGKYIVYTYAATGERIRKEAHANGSAKTTDYIEGFVYENTALAYFPMAEGRVRNASGVLTYEYFITDQQGNVRVSFEEGSNGLARIVQENHYYPFGLAMKGAIIRTALPGAANKNLYNGGSELQDDFGDDPNVYSTFFREYDPVLGRMNAADPMADKYASWTVYNYSFNDPVNLNDPSGADVYDDALKLWGPNYYYYNHYLTGSEQNAIQQNAELGYTYTGGDPVSGLHYVPEGEMIGYSPFTSVLSNSIFYEGHAAGNATSNSSNNEYKWDGIGVLLPEVSLSALKSGKYPAWWGHGGQFVNGRSRADKGTDGPVYDGKGYFGTNFIGPGPDIDPAETGLEPKDMIDRAAFYHDRAYAKAKVTGVSGALFSSAVRKADRILYNEAVKVSKMYRQGGHIDPVTKNPISEYTYSVANAVATAFGPIASMKDVRYNVNIGYNSLIK